MNPPIRVAVANQPRLMRDLVMSTMTDQPDIQVVAEIADESDIPEVVEETAPEFLIIASRSPNERSKLCDRLLRRFPNIKILVLAQEGSHCVFCWASFEIHATSFEASEAGILTMLRCNSDGTGTRQ